MKKFVFIILVFVALITLYGCNKKQQTLEEMQQPMSMETLTTMNTATPATAPAETKAVETKIETIPGMPAASLKLEPLPPSGPYKPTVLEIQTALKNAGFDVGTVDGKMGAKTKKAIVEFQKANALVADGKVGPKTWTALSKHLVQTEPVAPFKAR